MYERIPPHSNETENMVLSSMLFDDYGLSHGLTEATADMFYRPDNRLVFQAMNNLYVTNKGVDVVTLSEQLKSLNVFDKIGGLQRISDIASETYTSAHIKHHVAKLKEYYNRRKSIQYATEVINAAYDDNIDELTSKLSDIPNFEQAIKDKPTSELLQEAVIRVQERYKEPDKKRAGLLTGLTDLDYQIGGLRPEELIYISAEPNTGKSLLAHQICLKTAFDGLNAAYFNFEMSETSIGDRTLSMALPLDTKAIQNPNRFLTSQDSALINSTNIDKQLNNTLFIYTNTPPTIQAILSKCKQLRAKGKPLSLIAVDYLQLMDGEGKTQMEKVENISKGLKRIAKEFSCPVIAISSLAKDGKMRHSYQLEFDCDVLLHLETDRDTYREQGNESIMKPVTAEIKKNRNGRMGGIVNLALSLQYLKFRSVQNENRY